MCWLCAVRRGGFHAGEATPLVEEDEGEDQAPPSQPADSDAHVSRHPEREGQDADHQGRTA
jgi:hypothetical protein